MPTTKFCQGVSDINDTYMGFILDQWGVLHDGNAIFEGVTECLDQLKGRHKTVIIMSNSLLRAEETRTHLKKLGLAKKYYDHVVTSGEIIADGLIKQEEGVFKKIGKKCFIFGRRQVGHLLDSTDIEIVENIEDADFMIIAGVDGPMMPLEEITTLLKKAVRKQIKAICCNPDSHALLGANYLMGPGMIARKYQDVGGVVHYVGKPHGPIFQHCINILHKREVFPAQTVMIGDTMAHDIMGAHYMNIDTALVKTGLHAGVFRSANTPAEVDKTLDVLITHYNHIRPRYLLDRFEWGKALPDRKHKVHKKHVRKKKLTPRVETKK